MKTNCTTCNTSGRETVVMDISNTHAQIVDYLARLSYEMESHKNVIAELIERHKDDTSFIDAPLFKKYHERYEDACAAFQLGQNEFTETCIPKEFLTNPTAIWNLEYATYKLTITYDSASVK